MMEEARDWCVIRFEGVFFAMQIKGTPRTGLINKGLTKEEAEGLMKLLRTTQGESK